MFLLIGLGNPEQKYIKNRHNIGFMVVDEIANKYNFQNYSKKFSGQVAKGKIESHDCIILKPDTYMNRSGIAAAQAASFYKTPPENIYVFHDELELAFGKCRIKQGGGHGGHNGLKSLDSHISKNYWRVRMGIGRPAHSSQVTSYVLSDFDQDEWAVVDAMTQTITNNVPNLLSAKHSEVMNPVALAVQALHKDNSE